MAATVLFVSLPLLFDLDGKVGTPLREDGLYDRNDRGDSNGKARGANKVVARDKALQVRV